MPKRYLLALSITLALVSPVFSQSIPGKSILDSVRFSPANSLTGTIALRLDTLTNKVDHLVEHQSNPVFWSFLSALLAGVLVIIGQYIERHFRNTNARETEIRGIMAQTVYLLNLIPRFLHSLAYYKVDSRLQDCLSELHKTDSDYDGYIAELRKDFDMINDFELKINETIAQTISQLARLQKISASYRVETFIEHLSELKFGEKCPVMKTEADCDHEMLEKEVETLSKKYTENYSAVKNLIINSLKSVV